MNDYAERNGLFVPIKREDKLNAWRARHNIPTVDRETEDAALKALKDKIIEAITVSALSVGHLYGEPPKGTGALQAAAVAAVDAGAFTLMECIGLQRTADLLDAMQARLVSVSQAPQPQK